jgi:hypothetical protein
VTSRSGPLLAWLVIQILTLAFGAMRIPVWARSGADPQYLALAEMITVQIAVGTLLFPILFDKGFGLVAAISTLPFLQLAALLTATPTQIYSSACLALLIWLAGLIMWRIALPNWRARLIGVAVLNTVVIGFPLLFYLLAEFSDSSDQQLPTWAIMLSPLDSILSRAGQPLVQLAAPAFLLISGVIAVLSQRKKIPAPSYPQTYSPARRTEDVN